MLRSGAKHRVSKHALRLCNRNLLSPSRQNLAGAADGALLRRYGSSARAARAQGLEETEDAARHENDEEHEEYPVDRVGRADEADAEPDSQTLGQRNGEEGADRGPKGRI